MVKKDDKARMYSTKYRLESTQGVKKLMAHIAELSEHRFIRADFAVSDILIDLERALAMVELTDEEWEAINIALVLGYGQKDAAKALGVSQSTVSRRINTGCGKIANIFDKWAEEDGDYLVYTLAEDVAEAIAGEADD